MIRRKSHLDINVGEVQNDIRETRRQLTGIINVLFSLIGVFFAVYWVSAAFSSDMAIVFSLVDV